jgi:hypothetical protein
MLLLKEAMAAPHSSFSAAVAGATAAAAAYPVVVIGHILRPTAWI